MGKNIEEGGIVSISGIFRETGNGPLLSGKNSSKLKSQERRIAWSMEEM